MATRLFSKKNVFKDKTAGQIQQNYSMFCQLLTEERVRISVMSLDLFIYPESSLSIPLSKQLILSILVVDSSINCLVRRKRERYEEMLLTIKESFKFATRKTLQPRLDLFCGIWKTMPEK